MGPGLERIRPVSVHDHILRKVLQPQPFVRIGREGLAGIAVQDVQAALHPEAELTRHGTGVGMPLVRQEGYRKEHQGDGKHRHPGPQPYAQFPIHGDRARPG